MHVQKLSPKFEEPVIDQTRCPRCAAPLGQPDAALSGGKHRIGSALFAALFWDEA